MSTNPSKVPKSVADEAKLNPNGWVYKIDKGYCVDAAQEVPFEAIVGWWKVNGDGIVEGDFQPNPKYRPSKKNGSEA